VQTVQGVQVVDHQHLQTRHSTGASGCFRHGSIDDGLEAPSNPEPSNPLSLSRLQHTAKRHRDLACICISAIALSCRAAVTAASFSAAMHPASAATTRSVPCASSLIMRGLLSSSSMSASASFIGGWRSNPWRARRDTARGASWLHLRMMRGGGQAAEARPCRSLAQPASCRRGPGLRARAWEDRRGDGCAYVEVGDTDYAYARAASPHICTAAHLINKLHGVSGAARWAQRSAARRILCFRPRSTASPSLRDYNTNVLAPEICNIASQPREPGRQCKRAAHSEKGTPVGQRLGAGEEPKGSPLRRASKISQPGMTA
jgi:hypothetical protein